MKFNIDDHKGKKVVMHCKTEKEAKDFCNVLDKLGLNWSNGQRYSVTTGLFSCFDQEGICYEFNEGMHDSINYYLDEGYTILEWEDFMNKEFTKDDLKNGDVCVCRNGETCIAIPDVGTFIFCDGIITFNDFLTDLKHKRLNNYDIIDVFRPKKNFHCSLIENYENGEHIFQRAEPLKLTLKEIAEKFGVDEVEIMENKI